MREFAQAYRHSSAGEGQDRALRTPFRQTSAADSALAWAKHAITGAVLQLFTSHVRQGGLWHRTLLCWKCQPQGKGGMPSHVNGLSMTFEAEMLCM